MGHAPASIRTGAVRNRRLTPSGPAADLDAGTVATLFRQHHGELVRLAVLMVGDLPTAEDVVQDVYASLHSRWSQIAARDTVLPYVRAAVLNGVVLMISLVIAVTRHATESLPPANLQATPSYFVRIAGVGPSNR